jgi:dTDP-4-dehydrorhamnose reductase
VTIETACPPLPEVWGGIECTVNRVGSEFHDQVRRTGHQRRPGDLDRIAALGVTALRYPVLWERTAPRGVERADWRWPERRLGRLRELGVRPIVGLVHHGSGPRGTSLLDPAFADGLARFARACAERFEWVLDWVPVNEPLTTARFSALYGHWYPHATDDTAFVRALLTQCRAVVLAMRAIRTVIPGARLIQTEDLARTHSTRRLAYQAAFENERRWLTFDLLRGRVTRDHPLWRWLTTVGAKRRELEWFVANPCPPNIVGLNYYVTSERLLDERLERYGGHTHGTNGRDAYADVCAVRALRGGIAGPEQLLREAWERFALPLAITEAQQGCTRDEQLRWLDELWHGALAARAAGADVRAVTVWALLGAFDWDSLVTRRTGQYEAGAFDVRRGGGPRPTAVATMTRALATTGTYGHPVLSSPGWWRRSVRFEHPPAGARRAGSARRRRRPRRALLVTGGAGTLGRATARLAELRGLEPRTTTRAELDIADAESVARALTELNPWAVVNTAGFVRVDDAERDAERCRRENSRGPEVLAAACRERGIRLLTYSSDLVFDGAVTRPYVESDAVAPLSVYGKTKAEGERRTLAAWPSALVVRTSAFFGPWDQHNFLAITLRELRARREVAAAGDVEVSPTYVPDLVNASLDLLIDGETGVWHVANDGAVSWAAFARHGAAAAGVSTRRLRECRLADLRLPAPRPRYSVLGSDRGRLLPPLEDALARYVAERP